MEKLQVKQTLIDKGISYVAPQWGAKRLRARVAVALTGAYYGGSKSRRNIKEFMPPIGDADADTLCDLETLRNRSRHLLRNTPVATGAVNTNCVHVVGSGLKVQSRIDRAVLGMEEGKADEWQRNTELEFRTWAENLDCDITRGNNFYDLQNLVFRSTLESGDTFVLMPYKVRKSSPYGLKLQVIEADRVSNEGGVRDTRELTAGVEKSQHGEPVRYHVRTSHPGTDKNPLERKWRKIPAFTPSARRNIIHVYEQLRPGQTRGVPYLAPVIEQLHQLGRYTNAELQAAVVSGYLTVFVETESGMSGLSPMQPTDETGGKTSDKDYKLSSGAVIGLTPGEKISTVSPGRPNVSFDAFVQAILRQIGVALGIPFELLVMHFTKSYSAARSAMLNAWKMFSARREWLINHFCDLVYEAWMEEAVLRGRVIAPGFLDDPILRQAWLGNIWIGPAPGQIDPTKEVQAAQLRVDGGFSTVSEETAAMTGTDWDQKIPQIKKERKILKEAGIVAENTKSPSEQLGRAGEIRNPKDDDTDEDGDSEGDINE